MDSKNIEEYKKTSKKLNELKKTFFEKQKEFEKQNESLVCDIEKTKEEIEKIKSNITLEAISEFESTGNKKLLGGIGIREIEKIEYPKNKAFDWAKKHNMCLQLDDKAFKKICKVENIDFVKKTKKVTVTFPKIIK